MSEKEKGQKKNLFKGLRAEFKKIVWLDKTKLLKQTIAVVTSMVFLGILIALVDGVLKYGIELLLK